MTNEQRMSFLRFIANTIFQSKAMNTDITKITLTTNTGNWPGRMFNGGLRGYDFSLNLGDRTINLRCLEQNPNKTDNFGNLKKYAILARQGHQIMWVIDNKNNVFLGRLQNNVWHASFVPATTAATYQQPVQQEIHAPAASQDPYMNYVQEDMPLEVDELPEIPDGITVPDYVFEQIADMDEPPDWDNYNE